jgi:tetratricopeptide (TPR) repeat protein
LSVNKTDLPLGDVIPIESQLTPTTYSRWRTAFDICSGIRRSSLFSGILHQRQHRYRKRPVITRPFEAILRALQAIWRLTVASYGDVVRAIRQARAVSSANQPATRQPTSTRSPEPRHDGDRPRDHQQAAPLFQILEPLPLPAFVRRWLRARWLWLWLTLLIGLISLLANTLGIVSFFRPPSSGVAQVLPQQMRGDFNIAVARFSVANGVTLPPPEIESFEETLAEQITAGLSVLKPSNVQVWPPQWTGDLANPSPEIRASRMQERARAIHADIIVSAVVRPAGRGFTVNPELYLSDRQLPNARELVGRHEFPGVTRSALPSSFSGAFRTNLRIDIAERARGLTRFVAGLSAYAEEDYPQALRHLTAAKSDWNTADGQAMLALFRGNIAGKTGNYPAARTHYSAALRARPGDGRALLGLAELTYHDARGTCERDSGVDRQGLAAALRQYAAAALAEHRPAGADVESKAALGRGRVHLCLSQAALADEWDKAEAEFRAVIRNYEAGNQRIRPLASEAWVGLGLVWLPPEGVAQATDAYRRAVDAYQRAIELSDTPEQQGVFYGMLGHAYDRLGEQALAIDAYRNAAELDRANAFSYRKAVRELEQEP